METELKTAVGVHHTETDQAAWNAGANEKKIKDLTSAIGRGIYAWFESGADPTVRQSWKFPHHFVGDDGKGGAASTKACSAGIAVLNGGRGGASIPDADREGVWRHLAAHLTDAGMEPPPLKAEEEGEISHNVEPERKTISLKSLKLGSDGTFTALFAPFNVVDRQGDLTLPGAFGSQRVVISSYGHGSWSGMLPVGKGVIRDGEEGGIVEGQFFLDTTAGADTYKTVKNLGDLQEWSYALPEIDYEMRTVDNRNVRVLKRITVNEVSPVLMGAGNGTRTMAIKGMTFVEQMERLTLSAENVYDRLKGRVEDRQAAFRNPSAADLKRAREMKTRLEGIARKLGEIIDRHDAFTAAEMRFQAITGGKET